MTTLRRTLKTFFRQLGCPADPQTVPPDLENFAYQIAISPSGSRVVAWSKLRECERRLVMYKWIESLNDPRAPQNRVLLNDAVSAFLLTFEATIQFLKNQFLTTSTSPAFHEWSAMQPQYDLQVRGLRTLRHFEAHVESNPAPRLVKITVEVGKPVSLDSVSWKLPKLQSTDIARLRHSPLSAGDLIAWNTLVETTQASDVFGYGISRLKEILLTAEALL
jgi:hypothetical protein